MEKPLLWQVHLNVDGKVLVCATSWWNTQQISRYLGETEKPIWISLSSQRTEIFREITQLYYGNSPDLEKRFGHKGPFWGREYIFWRDRQPLSLIHEIFSPALEQYLGPMKL
ncbi:g8615 [Coccomyxa elongata]